MNVITSSRELVVRITAETYEISKYAPMVEHMNMIASWELVVSILRKLMKSLISTYAPQHRSIINCCRELLKRTTPGTYEVSKYGSLYGGSEITQNCFV